MTPDRTVTHGTHFVFLRIPLPYARVMAGNVQISETCVHTLRHVHFWAVIAVGTDASDYADVSNKYRILI